MASLWKGKRDDQFWQPSVCMSAAVLLKNRSPCMTAIQLLNTIVLYRTRIIEYFLFNWVYWIPFVIFHSIVFIIFTDWPSGHRHNLYWNAQKVWYTYKMVYVWRKFHSDEKISELLFVLILVIHTLFLPVYLTLLFTPNWKLKWVVKDSLHVINILWVRIPFLRIILMILFVRQFNSGHSKD